MKKLLSIIVLINLISCSKNNEEYKTVNKDELKKILFKKYDTKTEYCFWGYKSGKKYHKFKLLCQPNKKPLGSILEIKKMYQIEKGKIKLKNSITSNMIVKYSDIYWNK